MSALYARLFIHWCGVINSSPAPHDRIAIEYIIAEGDLVTVRSIWTGTYSGTYRDMKVPAPVAVKVIYPNTYRVANGRIGDNYWATDRLALAEALGFTLTPPAR